MSGNASRINGRKGGRPKGSGSSQGPDIPPELLAAGRVDHRHGARNKLLQLRELCRENDEQYVRALDFIALNSRNHQARISAIGMLWDRGHGKPIQPIAGAGGGGNIILQVITGCGEVNPDFGKWDEPLSIAPPADS